MNRTGKTIAFIIIVVIAGIAIAFLNETDTPSLVKVAIAVSLYPIYRSIFKKQNATPK